MNKKLFILLAVIALFLLFTAGILVKNNTAQQAIQSFDECAAAGYLILESYPPQCKTPDGRSFTAPLNSAEGAPTGSIHNLPVPTAVAKVRSTVAALENISENQVVILEALENDWPDACLGLADEDEMCAQVITSGYRVKATANGKDYTYRTNSDGSVIKREQ